VRRGKGDKDCGDLEGEDGPRGRVCRMENSIKDHSRVVLSILSEAACRYSQFGSTVHAESRTIGGPEERIVHKLILVRKKHIRFNPLLTNKTREGKVTYPPAVRDP
jgi:hypothetical protein